MKEFEYVNKMRDYVNKNKFKFVVIIVMVICVNGKIIEIEVG